MFKTFRVITLGCKVNQYESAFMEESLSRAGWQKADDGAPAHVLVINTCIVTHKAAHQSRQAIRKALRENPGARVAAVGCYAQSFPKELEAIEGLALIANNRVKAHIPDLLTALPRECGKTLVLPPFEPETPFDPLEIGRFPGRTRAYLKIQDGCESFCTYCIVPYARGPYRSLAPERAIEALVKFAEQGYREVVLTGIHLGKYGVDLAGNANLTKLLQMMGKEGLPLRLRLSSLEPQELEPEIIRIAASEPWLCPHFHIPLQSGDDRILKKMNRGYTAEHFAEKIKTIHKAIPLGAIGVDVMAGFPGEDAAAHGNALSLLRDLPVSYLHVFPFSPRKGTPAYHYKGRVDVDTIKQRTSELRTLGREKRMRFHENCLGGNFDVLVEGPYSRDPALMTGAGENYLPFIFPRDDRLRGHVVRMRATQVSRGKVLGKILT
ncbi:MAG: tRNA (N(6)-L-threonylcarbamoyladenosine(37)-C(2))-methylthiotransferase MtaB [Deltaproteobacteria bacterium]|nr:tRNA (N(6)-L-threonylcarbamoyladenosine(37)-C(2))-methylthiotransferase MtaB [Deltaproteobacteria bacterium]